MENRNIAGIQVVRGVAATLVLLYHASALISYRLGFDAVPYLWWGYSGVDIFFVLSGLIIFYSSATNPNLSPPEFFARRVWRIYPVYWIAIGVVLAISTAGQFMHVNPDSSTIEKVSSTNLSHLIGTLLLIPKSSEIILVAWTLSFEMVFYILFSLFFFKNKKTFFKVMTGWAICTLIAALIFNANYSDTHNPLVALLNPIMIEFLFGCVIAYYITKTKEVSKELRAFYYLAAINGILFFAMNVIIHHNLIDIPTNNQYFRFWYFGVPAAMTLYALWFLPIRYPKILVFMGDASYSIYLFHYPIMGVMAKIAVYKLHLSHLNVIGFILFVMVTLFLCSMVYVFIEKPILRFGKNYIKKMKQQIITGRRVEQFN